MPWWRNGWVDENLQVPIGREGRSERVMKMVLLSHVATTWTLVGLIWTIQCVHYPMFRWVGREAFARCHAAHTQQISWLVGPLMLLEVAVAGWLVWLGLRDLLFVSGLVCLAAVWISTGLIQVPLHDRLSQGYDAELVERLIRSNWIRTIAWTVRAVLLTWGLANGLDLLAEV